MVYEVATGKIINAISTPNEGVMPQAEEGQQIIEITDTDFAGIFNDQLNYYNAQTGQLEPEVIRKLSLLTQGPYAVGAVNLQFQQQTLDGQNVTEPVTFTVEVNGQTQTVLVEDGTLEVHMDCQDPIIVHLKITADRYETYEMDVIVQ
jgi:hypothetical protein